MNTFKSILNLLSPLIFIYYISCAVCIMILSVVDYEWTIGEEGIGSVCDVITHYNIDDIRDFAVPFTAVLLFPLVIYSIRKVKQKKFVPPTITTLLVIYWWWAFFGRFLYC